MGIHEERGSLDECQVFDSDWSCLAPGRSVQRVVRDPCVTTVSLESVMSLYCCNVTNLAPSLKALGLICSACSKFHLLCAIRHTFSHECHFPLGIRRGVHC